jgi:hypothetical protein
LVGKITAARVDDMDASDRPTVYRRIVAAALRKLRKSRKRGMNFSARHDLESRWQLIAPRLPPPPRWYLDIGTNNGDTLRRLSALGNFGIGLEVSRESAPATVPENAAVMITSVTADSLSHAPAFDGIFMLSVFHRIWAIQGPDEARAVLRAAISRAPLLFFEGSCRHGRWNDLGQRAPEFDDMNVESSVAWHHALLEESHGGLSVELLGVTSSLRTREPRPLFIVSR